MHLVSFTIVTELVCYSETLEPPTRLHGVTTHKPTLRILNMANTAKAFSAPVHTGGSQVTCTKPRSRRRALEDNRTNVERRTNGRTSTQIRNFSRHDVRTAVRHFAADRAICYCIAFCPGYTFRQPTYQTLHIWICRKTAYLQTTVFSL